MLLTTIYLVGMLIFAFLHTQAFRAPDKDVNGLPVGFKKPITFATFCFIVLGSVFWPGYLLMEFVCFLLAQNRGV